MQFSIPSISIIAGNIKATIIRFPLAMMCALVGTILGIVLIHVEDPYYYHSLLMTVTLAFPLFIGLVLLGDWQSWSSQQKWAANSLAALFLVGYYFWLPAKVLEAEDIFIIRYILWAIGFILFITFAPFLRKIEELETNAFWQYNRILFFSLVLTGLWAAAIQAGLSIAIASVDFLFNLNIDEERYVELGIIILGIFSTLFFLSRIPKNVESSENIENYPKELRLFSQYVLVPLVTLYFLILYAYVIRILILWQWPEGVLAYMILGFSLLGVAAYVSLYPLRQSAAWIRKVGTIFYIVLIPQVGMLFWALWFRLSAYGFTEKRYYVFVFGLWLLFIAIYFLGSKRKDIRIIPITLFFIVLFSSFGSWGAFAVSRRSQSNRLEHILVKNKLLVNGKIKKIDKELPFEDKKEISATIRYLIETHGSKSIQPWFEEDIEELSKSKSLGIDVNYSLPRKVVLDLMGIEYVEQWQVSSEDNNFYLSGDFKDSEKPINISGYDYMITLNSRDFTEMETEKGLITFRLDYDNGLLIVERPGSWISRINIKEFITKLPKSGGSSYLDDDKMTFEFMDENLHLKLLFTDIRGQKEENKYKIDSINAKTLFSLKR